MLRRIGVRHPFVLYVGNQRNHKNVPTLLEAFATLHADGYSQLVLVGPVTPQQQLQLNEQLERHSACGARSCSSRVSPG
ncbi:MAG: hypothetical protein U0514_04460 [Candidatus Andersenbacteria bacterium]